MKSLTEITYRGKSYPIKIKRKMMRRITMRPTHLGLLVNAPLGVPLSYIKNTVERHLPKLYPLLEKEAPLTKEHLYFLGRKLHNDDSYLKTIFKAPINDFLNPRFTEEFRAKALTYLTARVRHYETIMGIKKPYNVKIRVMKARLGANMLADHSLTFALALMHYSLPIIDAVVVHELAHDFAFNHSARFYEVLLKYYPNYKTEHAKIKNGSYQ
ncbi:MAG TPA: hypothetical protein DCM23_01080 [Firmicutes bacterium]|nr:hypothetical protein [Bacillota bacterium]